MHLKTKVGISKKTQTFKLNAINAAKNILWT